MLWIDAASSSRRLWVGAALCEVYVLRLSQRSRQLFGQPAGSLLVNYDRWFIHSSLCLLRPSTFTVYGGLLLFINPMCTENSGRIGKAIP